MVASITLESIKCTKKALLKQLCGHVYSRIIILIVSQLEIPRGE